MKYVVKAMRYLDKDGRGVSNYEEAHDFQDFELAELSALVEGGFVVGIEDGRIISESIKNMNKKKKKPVKANQLWITKQQNSNT